MSFELAHQAVQRFIIDKQYSTPKYDSIRALLDARSLNTTITEQDLGTILQTGKNRTIKISYYPIDCDAAADDCNQNLCDTGTVNEPVQEFFTMSRCTATKPKRLRVQDVRDIDGNYNFSQNAMAQINAGIGAWRKAFALELDTLLLANAGLQLDGNTTHQVSMTDNTNGKLLPWGKWQVEKDFADGGFTNPFIIGSTEVFQWIQSNKDSVSATNTTTGQDLARLGETNMYYDTLLNQVGGDTENGEHIIAFDPQAVKFVSYNKNVGIFGTDLASPEQLDAVYKRGGTDYIKGFFRDPVTGLMLDFYMDFKKCEGDDGAFDWYLKLNWDIFFPKIQQCNKQGVNGIFHYRTCPIKIPACPTGTTPPSPAVASEYDYTPGAIFPLTIGSITLGGVTSQPNVQIADITALVALFNDVLPNVIFSVDGSDVAYTGYEAITGSINNGEHSVIFS